MSLLLGVRSGVPVLLLNAIQHHSLADHTSILESMPALHMHPSRCRSGQQLLPRWLESARSLAKALEWTRQSPEWPMQGRGATQGRAIEANLREGKALGP